MRSMLFSMPGNEALTASLSARGGWALGALEVRRFPDEESYVRLMSDVKGKSAAIICTLARPDAQLLPLLFACRLLREGGARSIELVAPYLAYMRQDQRFHVGEALTSRHFADLLSQAFDGLITVDPHLHRYRSLSDVYTIDAVSLSASPFLADWIGTNIERPLVIGPDSESEQWAGAIAAACAAPHVVFSKSRRGDRDVRVEATNLNAWRGHNPVLVDDVISSGETLADAARAILAQGFAPPVCIAVHGVFASGAEQALHGLGCRVVTTNAIAHGSNAIDLTPLLCGALGARLGAERPCPTT
ncbi:ribose-phosphate pyrophosphokinase [Sphingobium algorifonticola]|uniref:Ribose-phosphate pyrophosphokinase n=2 Tax=Sphingobium algorifonticola TaxID=2008318 RepID=A0A437J4S1_9SPHN|nr:ribose-phosphate pyrophosphokinase [Sphingobium algorifonticola]